jgi:hypothetical protein
MFVESKSGDYSRGGEVTGYHVFIKEGETPPFPKPAPPAGSIIRDPNFYACMLNAIGQDDGYAITPADVANITAVYVAGWNIADLTGIEHFTAMTLLSASDNRLTTLDLSKNTRLTDIDLRWNQLTSVTLGAKPALTNLSFYGNKLSSLDVSGAPALEILNLWDNQLQALDISKNPALKTLWVLGNNFPSKAAITGLNESRLTSFIFDPQNTPPKPERPAAALKPLHAGFSDTSNIYILAAYQLGIISGTREPAAGNPGTFNPNGQFDRQSAAVMTMNVCRAIGANVANPPPAAFSDMDKAHSAAVVQTAIAFCAANGIMQGSNNEFGPADPFSRQQSIGLFNAIDAGRLP